MPPSPARICSLAGVDDRVAVLEGPALASLETLGERRRSI
jgi:hypothetical protein